MQLFPGRYGIFFKEYFQSVVKQIYDLRTCTKYAIIVRKMREINQYKSIDKPYSLILINLKPTKIKSYSLIVKVHNNG